MNLAIDKTLSYLISKGIATEQNFEAARHDILEIVRVAVEEEVSMVQIRERKLSARSLFELAAAAAAITRVSATKLLINDRSDIAVASGADGVHLTAISMPPKVIRDKFGPGFLIGVSTHSVEAVSHAAEMGADFAAFGPVFATPDKGDGVGTDNLAEACKAAGTFPVLALGGVRLGNLASVLGAGASGFAAIRSLNDADSLRSMMRCLST